MSRDSLNIFNIPAGVPFLDCLSDYLTTDLSFGGAFEAGFGLHDFLILLPTRRAVRELRQALLNKAGTNSLLLPDIKPLADVDETDLFFNLTDPTILDLPPVIPQLQRESFFMSEILNWVTESGADKKLSNNIVKAAALAADLSSFLNQAQTEEIDLSELQNLVDDQFSKNWQETVAFLSILTAKWPAYRDRKGGADPSEHRNRLLRAQAQLWHDTPPSRPVIAAGSTGSIPATADLLKQILHLPNGMVILPGLDSNMAPETWALLAQEDAHPQSGLYHLLQRLDVPRSSIRTFGTSKKTIREGRGQESSNARRNFLSLALLPSDHTLQWTRASQIVSNLEVALDGLHYYEAPDMRREAEVIALAMREALEAKGKKAVLVTPDRHLARRVAVALKRWKIDINDTAGLALADTTIGVLIRLSLEAVSTGFAPVSLLSVLKHPAVCFQQNRQAYLDDVQKLERVLLRGPRLPAGLNGLRRRLDQLEKADDTTDKRPDYAAIKWLLEQADAAFAPLVQLGWEAKVQDVAKALPDVLAALTGNELGQGDEEKRQIEEEVHNLLEDLTQIDSFGVPASEWSDLFTHWLAQRQTRPSHGLHPRLSIMGLLEARLVEADLMILGGLNEGSWPHLPDTGPWVSRPMRNQLGMTSPERRIGLMAHDFVQAACAPQVLMTRSKKTGGTPMVASRWLTRMQALAKGIGGENAGLPKAERLAALAAGLDPAPEVRAAEKPRPTPPVQVRPKRLSVTQVEKLQRNPYAVYARHILGLKKLDLPDSRSTGAVRGTLIHNILEGFAKATPDGLPEDSSALMAELVASYAKDMPGGHSIMTYWDARMKALTQWLVSFEEKRRDGIQKIFAEVKGTRNFKVTGRNFTLSAVADRIELHDDQSLSVLDYKTYKPPKASEVLSQKAPQLLLESLIARSGGFEGVPLGEVSSLVYLHVSGGHPAGALHEINGFQDALDEAEAGLVRLIDAFNDPATPYAPHTQPKLILFGDDYDHLARLAEWSSQDGEEA